MMNQRERREGKNKEARLAIDSIKVSIDTLSSKAHFALKFLKGCIVAGIDYKLIDIDSFLDLAKGV